MVIQTESFQESNCKRCKTPMLVEKNVAAVLACHFGDLWGQFYDLTCYKKFEPFCVKFVDKSMLLNSIFCFISTFSQHLAFGKFKCLTTSINA